MPRSWITWELYGFRKQLWEKQQELIEREQFLKDFRDQGIREFVADQRVAA